MKATEDLADKIVLRLYDVLDSVARNARYDNWQFVREKLQHVVGAIDGENAQKYQPRDLLNAAWAVRARGDPKSDPVLITRRILELFDMTGGAPRRQER